MAQITIRGLGPELEGRIRQMARDRQQSINAVLTEIIRESLERGQRRSRGATFSLFSFYSRKRLIRCESIWPSSMTQ